MKSLKIAAIISLISAPAMASENFSYNYVDVSASQTDYDGQAFGLSKDLPVHSAKAELSIEADGVALVASHEQIKGENETAGVLIEGEVSEVGVKFIHSSPDLKDLDLTLQLSGHMTEMTATMGGLSAMTEDNGYSVELGGRYVFSKRTDLEVSYKKTFYKDELFEEKDEARVTGRFYFLKNKASLSASYVYNETESELFQDRVEVGLRLSF